METRTRGAGWARWVAPWALGFLVACTAVAPRQAAPSAPPPGATAPAAATPAATAPAAAAAARPALATSPVVDLKVNALPIAAWAPYYIAQERGYFRDVGLNVEFAVTSNTVEALPSLAQGQIQVGNCASAVACFNALNRGTDMKIVADMQSAGKTAKSDGNVALVVRKDLWDNGTVRTPQDLVGRSIYNVAGPGSASYIQAARWLLSNGVDPHSIDWPLMPFPDQLAAMLNKGIEVSIETEPLVTAGVERGAFEIMATQEAMYPTTQVLYVMYWGGIDRLGQQVGERFMVAHLRAVRAYIDAFEYGVDQDAIIKILTDNTTIKDPAVWKQIKYSWVDPNGVVNRAALEADAELLRQLGLLQTAVDLAPAFDDHYREFAVRYLGEYQPPAGAPASR
ncbi:MAG TPA: ABC transporter substrate-binding protein [Chloroflexota bacterium]|nr:ABC transporter substrate-binding protein [Chloroflexota bacterium]